MRKVLHFIRSEQKKRQSSELHKPLIIMVDNILYIVDLTVDGILK